MEVDAIIVLSLRSRGAGILCGIFSVVSHNSGEP